MATVTTEELDPEITQSEIDQLIEERESVGASSCSVDTRNGQRVLVCQWPPLVINAALLRSQPSLNSSDSNCCEADDQDSVVVKPAVDRFESTTHQSSRNGEDIDHIIIHYTTSRNINGTINHFKHGSPRVSAHYIIGRDGELVQMVSDSDRAWHAGNSQMNARSIGIEHVAAPGDRITSAQADISIHLLGWLMQEYDVPKGNVVPHVCIKPTDCCGDLFAQFGGGAGKSCDEQTSALHQWMTSKGI